MALSVPRLLPTKTYPFSDIRHMLAATGIQPGVVATGATTEFKVTQDTGSNMNVKVLQGDSGAWVIGLDTTRQGGYHVYNDAAVTLAVPAAHATLPRIDQLVLRVYDSNVIGGGTDAGAFEVIQGTATAGAQATNAAGANYRAGAANLATIAAPKTLIRLSDVLVPAASTAVTNANIVDRRQWAMGAYVRLIRSAVTDYTTTLLTFAAIDGTNLGPRIECSGVPLRVTLNGKITHSATDGSVLFQHRLDGAAVDGTTGTEFEVTSSVGTKANGFSYSYDMLPAAGSHIIAPYWALRNAGTGTLQANTVPVELTIEEIVRQNTSNT